jgi:hypothetical protein
LGLKAFGDETQIPTRSGYDARQHARTDANRRDRPNRSGRSPDWIKVKNPNAPAASRIMEW